MGFGNMLVGVISDTHDNLDKVRIAARIFFKKRINTVLHLGDIIAPFTLRVFREEGIEKLIAVFGNNCGEKLGLKRVADSIGYEIHEPPFTVELTGKKILMLHGQGSIEATASFVNALAKSRQYDIILYGHTHRIDHRFVDNVLILNPGEACGCLTGKPTAAILDTKTLHVELLDLSR